MALALTLPEQLALFLQAQLVLLARLALPEQAQLALALLAVQQAGIQQLKQLTELLKSIIVCS
jgi:hypothetical protein